MSDKETEVLDHETQLKLNLGTRAVKNLPTAKFPDADLAVRAKGIRRPPYKVDILLVNPPTPDRAIWIRSQHRVGRRSRENMIWPQMELAQMASMLMPDYQVEIIDANALRMSWQEFEARLKELRPRFYLTQVTAPTLTNDMYGAFLARSLGAITIGFGTHVTPMPRETLEQFPALDFVLRGEPELTLRELLDAEPLHQGLAELVAYLELAHAGHYSGALDGLRALVDEAVEEPVRWQARSAAGEPVTREARLPRVIFTR